MPFATHQLAFEALTSFITFMAFVIKKAKLKGRGVFTTKAFKPGAFVHLLSGDRLTAKQIDVRIDAELETTDDPLQISRNLYIDLDELSRTFNHSCDPNCGIRQESKLYALREIKVGDEVTYDYSTTVPKYKAWWKMRCQCGSQNCRKIISSYNTIPKKQLKYYADLKVLPLWIRKYPEYSE